MDQAPSRPSERVAQYKAQIERALEEQVDTRRTILSTASALAIGYPDGCEASKQVPTKSPGRTDNHTWEFRHDPDGSYQLTALVEWDPIPNSTSRQTTWTFDAEMPVPIHDVIGVPDMGNHTYPWNELKVAFDGLVAALEPRAGEQATVSSSPEGGPSYFNPKSGIGTFDWVRGPAQVDEDGVEHRSYSPIEPSGEA